jgi:hypothetical protein
MRGVVLMPGASLKRAAGALGWAGMRMLEASLGIDVEALTCEGGRTG